MSAWVVGPDKMELIQNSLRTLRPLRSMTLVTVLAISFSSVTLASSAASLRTRFDPPKADRVSKAPLSKPSLVTMRPAAVARAAAV